MLEFASLPLIDPVIGLTIRGAFALLFALSGVEKFNDRLTFQFQLEQYQLVPAKLAPQIATGIIFLELSTAIMLLTQLPFYGVVSGGLLLAVYAIGILINLLRGRTWMDCGCLGSSGEGLSYWLVSRNLLMLGALLFVFFPTDDRSLLWLDYFTIIIAVLGASIAYVVLNTLLAADARSKMWWS